MVNTILAKRINHIVAKGDNPVWPKGSKSRGFSKRHRYSFFCFYFVLLSSVRVTRTSKAMQTAAIRTVAKSLPPNEVIFLTLFISRRYIPYTDLRKNFVVRHCEDMPWRGLTAVFQTWKMIGSVIGHDRADPG